MPKSIKVHSPENLELRKKKAAQVVKILKKLLANGMLVALYNFNPVQPIKINEATGKFFMDIIFTGLVAITFLFGYDLRCRIRQITPDNSKFLLPFSS